MLMLVRMVYRVGGLASVLVQAGAALVGIALPAFAGTPGSPQMLVGPIAVALFAGPAGVVVHEAGHALACLALGAKIRAVYLGSVAPGRRRLTLGKVIVTPSRITSGRVEHEGARSTLRDALITAAGSLADVIAAGALLAVFQPGNRIAQGLAVIMAGVGVASLFPYRTRGGRLTDGARLLGLMAGGVFAAAARSRDVNDWLLVRDAPRELRAEFDEINREWDGPLKPERTTRWLGYYYQKETLAWVAASLTGRSLRREGRITELLALHADLRVPAGPFLQALTRATHQLAWEVLLVPGLPVEEANRAVQRVRWVLDNADFTLTEVHGTREGTVHTLALGKLRQGHFAAVEELCQPALAIPNAPPAARATVLATIVLARKALGQPHEQLLAEAVALAPTADLVPEAAAAALSPATPA